MFEAIYRENKQCPGGAPKLRFLVLSTGKSSDSLFTCQDEDENEDKNKSFGMVWNLCMTNELILQYIIVLRAWFVRHRLYPERTKTFIFGFVLIFVLAHEPAY